MKSRRCVMIGYTFGTKGYRLWDLERGKVIRVGHQHAIFNESCFPFKDKKNWTKEQLDMPTSYQIPVIGNLSPKERDMYGLSEEDLVNAEIDNELTEDVLDFSTDLPLSLPEGDTGVTVELSNSIPDPVLPAKGVNLPSEENHQSNDPDTPTGGIQVPTQEKLFTRNKPELVTNDSSSRHSPFAPRERANPFVTRSGPLRQSPFAPRESRSQKQKLTEPSPPLRRSARIAAKSNFVGAMKNTAAVMWALLALKTPYSKSEILEDKTPLADMPYENFSHLSRVSPDRAGEDLVPESILAYLAAPDDVSLWNPTVPMSKPSHIPAPENLPMAMKDLYWPYYKKAMDVEIQGHEENGTWEWIARDDVPKGHRILRDRWVFADKKNPQGEINGAKARLTAMGCHQEYGVNYFDTYSSTTNQRTLKIQLAMYNDDPSLEFDHWDVKQAFVTADLEEEIYMKAPTGYERRDRRGRQLVCRLKKGLYGIHQASRGFQKKLAKDLGDFGCTRLEVDDACYYISDDKGRWIFISTYVDDLFVLSNSSQFKADLFSHLKTRVPLKDMGTVECALSMNIQTDRKAGLLKISNRPYAELLLKKFGLNGCTPAPTPMVIDSPLSPLDWPTEDSVKEEMKRLPFRQLLGSLWWLAWCSRPDILVAVHECSKHVEHPSPKLWSSLTRILRYLKGTKDWGIVMQRSDATKEQPKYGIYTRGDYDFRQNRKISLEKRAATIAGWVDGDWASCLIDRRSRTGALIYFLDQPVGWMSEMQTSIALSSTESEFYGLVKVGKAVLWLYRLVSQLGYKVDSPVPVHCDNQSAIALSKFDHFNKRSKHFDLSSKIVQKWVRDDAIIDVRYVSTDEQLADFLTKPLGIEKFTYFRGLVMGDHRLQNRFPRPGFQ